jgi:hypothetical protein
MGSISAIVVHEGEAEKRSIERPCVEARLHDQWTRVNSVHVVDHHNLVGVEGETAPRPRPVEAAIGMELYRTLLPCVQNIPCLVGRIKSVAPFRKASACGSSTC